MKVRGQKVHTNKERLEKLSKVNKESGCVEWQSSMRNGYGRLTIGSRTDGTRKTVSAHRLSYFEYVGDVPDGMYVCHKCDNRSCINPDHLFLGTHQDNIDDRERKGRNNHTRKLYDEDIINIHNLKGIKKSKELANIYNVSYHTIKDIWCGKQHSHLKPTPKESEK